MTDAVPLPRTLDTLLDMPLDEIAKQKRKQRFEEKKSKQKNLIKSKKQQGMGKSLKKNARNSAVTVAAGGGSQTVVMRGGGLALRMPGAKVPRDANEGLIPHRPSIDQSRPTSLSTGTVVEIANLLPSVTDEDIMQLCSTIGNVKSALIMYDRNRNSLGKAEVVFQNGQDAALAVKKFNGVPLDGRPLRLKVSGSNIARSLSQNDDSPMSHPAPTPTRALRGAPMLRGAVPRLVMPTSQPVSRPVSGGRRGGRGGGRGGARAPLVAASAEALDGELDNYFNN